MVVIWMYFCVCALISWRGIMCVSERYFMEDECGRTLDMERTTLESIRLEVTKFREYHNNFDCMVRITAPLNKFLQVQVETNEIERSVNCTKDYLQLFDGPELNGKVLAGAVPRICSSTRTLLSYTTTGRHLAIRFKSDSEGAGYGFRLLITAFRVDSECYKTEFRCNKDDKCISEELVCNRFKDCTDSSDECELSTAAVIGISVASVLIVMSIIGIVVCWCCLRKRRERAGSTKRLAIDLTDSQNSKHIFHDNADIHYYRPKTVYHQNIEPMTSQNSHSSSGSFHVHGPYPEYMPESLPTRQKWITVPPTTLKDADGNYFSPYSNIYTM